MQNAARDDEIRVMIVRDLKLKNAVDHMPA